MLSNISYIKFTIIIIIILLFQLGVKFVLHLCSVRVDLVNASLVQLAG